MDQLLTDLILGPAKKVLRHLHFAGIRLRKRRVDAAHIGLQDLRHHGGPLLLISGLHDLFLVFGHDDTGFGKCARLTGHSLADQISDADGVALGCVQALLLRD